MQVNRRVGRCLPVQLRAAALGLLGLGLAFRAHGETAAVETVPWNKVPLEIALKVGAETQIQFPASVKVGVPNSVKSVLRTQSIADTVYFQASENFDVTRVIVQTRDGVHTYLLDVSATADAEAKPILRLTDLSTAAPVERPPSMESSASPEATIDPVALTRFAAQQLYAPSRLLYDLPGVVREPVRSRPVDLLRGGAVNATPLIAWRSGSLHLTAVSLRNVTATPIELDPRALRGEWLTATFQHNRLLAAGDEADLTVVYLVSLQPFAVAR